MICLFFILLLKYNNFGDFVEKKRVKMIREQKIDEELLIEEQEMDAYQIDENEIIYEGKTKEGPFMMKFMFIEGGVFVKVHSSHYQAMIPFILHSKQEGSYQMGNHVMKLDFVLREFDRKGLAIYMKYDIFSKQSVISNNKWKVSVI